MRPISWKKCHWTLDTFICFTLLIIHLKLCFASGELWKYYTGQKTVFTRSAITPPKVYQFGWNLEHCEHIVGGWPRQILGAICAVATVWEAAEILFFCQVNKSARFHRFPIGQILLHLNMTTAIGVATIQPSSCTTYILCKETYYFQI